MNELAHLKRLATVKTNAGIKFLTPAAFPGNHCPLHTALALSSNIEGMSTLVVGTAECATYSRNVIYKSEHRDSGLHWVYVLDSNEVVFGCRKGLTEALRSMSKAGARAIMLIFTCVPEVIGEDGESIVEELQPELKAKLCFVALGHFKCNSYPSGFWKTLQAFTGMIEPLATESQRINVLGRAPKEEHIPMPQLLTELNKKGFQLRMLAPGSRMEDFTAAADARLNLVLSPYMDPLAQRMKEELGIPFISLHDAYSVEQIDAILEQLAKELSIDWKDSFAAARREAVVQEERARKTLGEVSYITTPRNPLQPLPLTSYLTEFQMNPLLLHMEEFYPADRRHDRELLTKHVNPLLCHMVNDKADAAVLEKLAPALTLGEIYEGTGSIPEVPYLYELYGQAGYERTTLLLNRILTVLEAGKAGQRGEDTYGSI